MSSSIADRSPNSVPVLNEHVLVSDHHLHLSVVHEILMISVQSSPVFVVKKLGERQIVREDKCADGVIVHEFGRSVHYVLDHLSVALQVICLYMVSVPIIHTGEHSETTSNAREIYKAIADDTMPLEDRNRTLGMIVVVVLDEVLI